MKLTAFINDIDAAYKDARKEYAELNDEIAKLNTKLHDLKFGAEGKKYDFNYKNDLIRECEGKIRDLKKLITITRSEFESAADTARDKAIKAFSGKYSISPDKLDLRLVEMLKSGLLTDGELMELSKKYMDTTNCRLIGKHLSEKDSADLRREGNRLIEQSMQRPDMDTIDALVCGMMLGLRDDPVLANGYHKQAYEQNLATALQQAENISTDE